MMGMPNAEQSFTDTVHPKPQSCHNIMIVYTIPHVSTTKIQTMEYIE